MCLRLLPRFGVRLCAAACITDRPEQLPRQNHIMIAVTFALPAESAEFVHSLSNKSRADRNGVRTIRGKIEDRTIEVLLTGVDEKVCRRRLGKFLHDSSSTFDQCASGAPTMIGKSVISFCREFSTVHLSETRASLSGLHIHIANLGRPFDRFS
jgi:hypothetical protein